MQSSYSGSCKKSNVGRVIATKAFNQKFEVGGDYDKQIEYLST